MIAISLFFSAFAAVSASIVSTTDAPRSLQQLNECFNNTGIRHAVDLWFEDLGRTENPFGNIGDWCTGEVTDFNKLFEYCNRGESDFDENTCNPSFNENLSLWDVSQSTSMSDMLSFAVSFNTPVSDWDVSRVENMLDMFRGASTFNRGIASWDVSRVLSMRGMFKQSLAFNNDLSSWNVARVTDMQTMFTNATRFNRDLSAWKITSVTKTKQMFKYASSFNQDLSSWSISGVTDMREMFSFATSFSQCLRWDTTDKRTNEMFEGSKGGKASESCTPLVEPFVEWSIDNAYCESDLNVKMAGIYTPRECWYTCAYQYEDTVAIDVRNGEECFCQNGCDCLNTNDFPVVVYALKSLTPSNDTSLKPLVASWKYKKYSDSRCRTDEGEIGEDGNEYKMYYHSITRWGLDQCKEECSSSTFCTGFEYTPGMNCEIWEYEPTKFLTEMNERSIEVGARCYWKDYSLLPPSNLATCEEPTTNNSFYNVMIGIAVVAGLAILLTLHYLIPKYCERASSTNKEKQNNQQENMAHQEAEAYTILQILPGPQIVTPRVVEDSAIPSSSLNQDSATPQLSIQPVPRSEEGNQEARKQNQNKQVEKVDDVLQRPLSCIESVIATAESAAANPFYQKSTALATKTPNPIPAPSLDANPGNKNIITAAAPSLDINYTALGPSTKIGETAAPTNAASLISEANGSKTDALSGNSAVSVQGETAKECCICLDALAIYLLTPCFHMCLCENCKKPFENGKSKECPMCRQTFQELRKVS